jgi:hypothetical protein
MKRLPNRETGADHGFSGEAGDRGKPVNRGLSPITVHVFLSTDDKLVRAAKRQQKGTEVEIENPLTWRQSALQ